MLGRSKRKSLLSFSSTTLSNVTSNSNHNNNNNSNKTNKTNYSSMEDNLQFEIGLENLGNTCFVNSSLQCLLHIRPLIRFFIENDISLCLNYNSPMKGQLAKSFNELVREVYNASSGSCVSPLNFLRAISMHAPNLLDQQQQDCQEFLHFLLDGMSEDLCRNKTTPLSNSPSTNLNVYPNIEQQKINSTNSPINSNYIMPSVNNNDSISELATTLPSINIRKINSVDKLRHRATNSRDPTSSSSSIVTSAMNDLTISPVIPLIDAASPVTKIHNPQSPVNRAHSKRYKSRQNSRSSNMSEGLERQMSGQIYGNSEKLRSNMWTDRPETSVDAYDKDANVIVENANKSQNSPTTNITNQNEIKKSIEEIASDSWNSYLKFNDSIITDLFAGQLQSTVRCLTCQHASYCFEPFIDISVSIPKETNQSSRYFLTRRFISEGNGMSSCTLEECLEKYTSEETLDGDNKVTCDHCKIKQKCVKTLNIYKYPKILVIHIKRFRFNNVNRDKLLTDVNFPLNDFSLLPFLSKESPFKQLESKSSNLVTKNNNEIDKQIEKQVDKQIDQQIDKQIDKVVNEEIKAMIPPYYDLIGVSNHSGNMTGGHYIAHINTVESNLPPRWICFNDARVSLAAANNIAGPTAYILFYKLRDDTDTSFESNNKEAVRLTDRESNNNNNIINDPLNNNINILSATI